MSWNPKELKFPRPWKFQTEWNTEHDGILISLSEIQFANY